MRQMRHPSKQWLVYFFEVPRTPSFDNLVDARVHRQTASHQLLLGRTSLAKLYDWQLCLRLNPYEKQLIKLVQISNNAECWHNVKRTLLTPFIPIFHNFHHDFFHLWFEAAHRQSFWNFQFFQFRLVIKDLILPLTHIQSGIFSEKTPSKLTEAERKATQTRLTQKGNTND